jgi:hypothetical protein
MGRWTFPQEVCEYLCRGLVKELVLDVGGWLVKGCGDRIGLCIRGHLLSRPPVRTTRIQRVQNDIAALLVIEPLEVFGGRIVDDGGVAALANLTQDLHDELGLADAGVPHDLEVLGFLPGGDTHHLSEFGCFETDAVALLLLVEFLRAEQLRPTKNPAILHLFEAPDVIRDGEPKHRRETDAALNEADGEDCK